MPSWVDRLSQSPERWPDRLLLAGLRAAVPAYALANAARHATFDLRLRSPRRLPRPVISVGNLTTGGVGKTPVVVMLIDLLRQRGRQPGVLTRGYGSDRPDDSDEVHVYRSVCNPPPPIGVHARRFQAGLELLDREPEVDVLLLDDGFQHRQLHRDLDLLLVDATNPFGFDSLLPRGLLREPIAAARRADLVAITRCEQVTRDTLDAVRGRLRRHVPAERIIGFESTWTGWRTFREGEQRIEPLEALRGERVLAACGLGNPAAFFEQLRGALGGEPVHREAFADHHPYTDAELDGLARRARDAGASWIVTTEKDWVKWRDRPPGWPVARPVLAVRPAFGEAALLEAIDRVLAARSADPGGRVA